jgi:hypothetical protein
MIKKALNHTSNTVCVNEEQVERMLEVFEKLGMLPPLNDWSLHTDGDKADADNVLYYTWEEEDEK